MLTASALLLSSGDEQCLGDSGKFVSFWHSEDMGHPRYWCGGPQGCFMSVRSREFAMH